MRVHDLASLIPLVPLLAVASPAKAQTPPARVATERYVIDRWSSDQGLPQNTVTGILQTPDGYFWLGTYGGLIRFDGVRFTAFSTRSHPTLGSDRVMAIQPGAHGNIWIGTDRALVRFHEGTFTEFGAAQGRPEGFTERLSVDTTGVVWLWSSVGGGARFDGERFTPFRELGVPDSRRDDTTLFRAGVGPVPDGARGTWRASDRALIHRHGDGRVDSIVATAENGLRSVRTLFVDRERTLWIGTMTHGLLRVRPRLFHMVRQPTLADDAVAAIMRDRRGRLWVGSSCGTTTILTGSQARYLPHPGCAFSFAETRDGIVWSGSYGGGLNRVAPDFSYRQFTTRDGLPHDVVLALYPDADTSLWIGTDNGLAHYRNGAFRTFTSSDGLPSPRIQYITRDRDGALWVATAGGIARLEDGRFRSWTQADGLAHDNVRAIHQDDAGVYWIGTYGGGISRFDGERFVTIASSDGLFDDVVSSILEDAGGFLWMAGNRGVFRVHRRMLDAFARGEVPRVVSVGYGPSDGLLTAETNGGFQPSAWQDADGRLWFATIRGLASVLASDAEATGGVPGVAIEEIRVDGRAVETTDALRLARGARNIEIQYTGLTSIAPELLIFRYRMEGLDSAWVHVGGRRTAYFSGLPPGRYRFVVSAASRDGVWNEVGQELSLTIPAPWYATWWFRVAMSLAIAALVLAFVRFRLRRLQEQQRIQREFARRLLEGQESERRRLAGELHDSLGQDLLVMKNRASMALRDQRLDPAVRQHVEEIAAAASHAVQNAREISHALRPYQLDRLGLVAALRDLAERASVPESLAVAVHSDASMETADIDPEVATHVFRIAQEAIANVLKHADARAASVTIGMTDGTIQLQVSDNGKGADLARGMGFGLTGITERVRFLGGTFDVRVTPGAGTTLDVRVRARAVPPSAPVPAAPARYSP